MWCWRRAEEIAWTDRVKNGVLHEVKEERNILHTLKRKEDYFLFQTFTVS